MVGSDVFPIKLVPFRGDMLVGVYTDWLIGILILAYYIYYNPYKTV